MFKRLTCTEIAVSYFKRSGALTGYLSYVFKTLKRSICAMRHRTSWSLYVRAGRTEGTPRGRGRCGSIVENKCAAARSVLPRIKICNNNLKRQKTGSRRRRRAIPYFFRVLIFFFRYYSFWGARALLDGWGVWKEGTRRRNAERFVWVLRRRECK